MTHPQTGQFGHIILCTNPNCRDVIDGSPIPAMAARSQEVYCGFNAKHWKKREESVVEDAQVVSILQK